MKSHHKIVPRRLTGAGWAIPGFRNVSEIDGRWIVSMPDGTEVVCPERRQAIRAAVQAASASGAIGNQKKSARMRLFLHLVDGAETIRDGDGVVIEGSGLAEAVAREVAEFWREFWDKDRKGWRLHVADETGSVLFTIPLDGRLH
jgi:hypothetical protein